MPLLHEDDIVTGEKIQELCDVYCGIPSDLMRNPRIVSQMNKHLNLEQLNTEYNNPKLVFCYSNSLKLFMTKMVYFKNPFVLVSHNEDTNITKDYLPILESEKVIQWFAQNPMITHKKLHFLPIGIPNVQWHQGDMSVFMQYYINQPQEKTLGYYFYFSIGTNPSAREQCKQEIESKGLAFQYKVNHPTYLQLLSHHKMAICPDGNGVDSHRIWEALYLGVVPILKRCTFTDYVKELFPCIVLNEWTEFDEETCLNQYDTLKGNLDSYQQYLTMGYWKSKIYSSFNSDYVDLDFLEIGTSNFDTLLQICAPTEVGMSVEPIQYYLDTLPSKSNVKKVRCAITANRTSDTIKLFFIPEPILTAAGLPWWLKGCNSVNDYHPKQKEFKLEQYVMIEECPLLNVDEFLTQHNIRSIKYLKIDTEGHDTVIMNGLLDYLQTKPVEFYPKKILFETNANTPEEKVRSTVEKSKLLGYTMVSTGEDTLLELK